MFPQAASQYWWILGLCRPHTIYFCALEFAFASPHLLLPLIRQTFGEMARQSHFSFSANFTSQQRSRHPLPQAGQASWPGLRGRLTWEGHPQCYWVKTAAPTRIHRERLHTLLWQHIVPGIVPPVLKYSPQMMVTPWLPGQTLAEVVTHALLNERITAASALSGSLAGVFWLWARTAQQARTAMPGTQMPTFTSDLFTRLPSALARHPWLAKEHWPGGQQPGPSLCAFAQLEARHAPALTVWCHGDFNLDNILNAPATTPGGPPLFLVDLHRSHWGDPVRDAATLAVSCARLPDVFARWRTSQDLWPRIQTIQAAIFHQLRGLFPDDRGLPLRWQLGLARYYWTSTRLVADAAHARWLWMQGCSAFHLCRHTEGIG